MSSGCIVKRLYVGWMKAWRYISLPEAQNSCMVWLILQIKIS